MRDVGEADEYAATRGQDLHGFTKGDLRIDKVFQNVTKRDQIKLFAYILCPVDLIQVKRQHAGANLPCLFRGLSVDLKSNHAGAARTDQFGKKTIRAPAF